MGAPKGAAEKLAAQSRFLNALTLGVSVEAAAIYAAANRRTLYRWRSDDADFATAWQKAEQGEKPSSPLEAEAIRRAVMGVQKPVYRGGEIVGHTTDYSDSMLMFLLKAYHPEKYDTRSSAQSADIQPDLEGAKDALYGKFRQALER